MTRKGASGKGAGTWRVAGNWGPVENLRWVMVTRWPVGPPFDIDVRLGSESGRLFVTGLRIGNPDGHDEYEIKDLRSVHLGDILLAVREALASEEPRWTTPIPILGGRTRAELLLDNADPALVTVRRGRHGDPETDLRTLERYEAARARGLRSADAALEVSGEMYVSVSQVYRRVAKARKMRQEEDT